MTKHVNHYLPPLHSVFVLAEGVQIVNFSEIQWSAKYFGIMFCFIKITTLCIFGRFTLIPTSMILGLGAAPLWSAKCTYLTMAGNLYAQKVGKIGKYIVTQYFGIFFLIYRSSGVWGNLIASLVFGQTPNKGNYVVKKTHEAYVICK